MDIDVDLFQLFLSFLIKKSSGDHKGAEINSDVVSENQQLAEELRKPIIRKFGKRNVYSFLATICGMLIYQICN